MARAHDNPANDGVVAVSNVTSTEILAANNSRDYALLINNGADDVWVSLGNAAVVGEGIRLAANGGTYEMSPAFGNLFVGAVNGLAAGAGAVNVPFTELA